MGLIVSGAHALFLSYLFQEISKCLSSFGICNLTMKNRNRSFVLCSIGLGKYDISPYSLFPCKGNLQAGEFPLGAGLGQAKRNCLSYLSVYLCFLLFCFWFV